MTHIVTQASPGWWRSASLPRTALSYVHGLVRRWRYWNSLRTIESLPHDIQKDIGWPAADAKR